MSSNNKSIFLSVIFTFLGLVISLYRDVHLSGNISDTSFFVTYISICALITTPLSERMQYGISSKKNYLTLLFASLPILIINIFFVGIHSSYLLDNRANLFFWIGTKYFYLYCDIYYAGKNCRL